MAKTSVKDFILPSMSKEALNNLPFGAYVINPDGFIEFFNDKMVQISGAKDAKNIEGQNVLQIPTYKEYGLLKYIENGLKGEPFIIEGIKYVSHIGKKETIRSYYGIPIKDKKDKVVKLLCIVEDITEKKKYQNEIKVDLVEKEILLKEVQYRAKNNIQSTDSEKNLQAILEASPDIIHLLDANGIILATSSNFARMFNKNLDEIIGTCVFDLFSRGAAAKRKAALSKVFSTGKSLQIIDKARSGIFETHIHPVFDEKGKTTAAAVYARDITERRRAEIALIESEAKFKGFLESAKDLIQSVDSNGKFTYVNSAWKKMLGYTDEDVGKLIFTDIIDIKEREHCLSIFQKLLKGKKINRIKTIFRSKKGEKIYVEGNINVLMENGEFKATQGIFRDITASKEQEKKINFLSSMVEQSNEGMAVADLNGYLLFVNHAWTEMHGYNAGEKLVGRHLKIFHNEEQLKKDVAPFNQKVMESGFNTGEVGHIRRDGVPFPALMTTTILKDKKGRLIAIAGIAKDITERKRAEEELHKKNTELERTNKLMVGRELKMIELKKRIKELEKKLS